MKLLRKSAFTLTEALVSLLLIALILLGSTSFYGNANEVQGLAIHKKIASEMLNSRLEQFKNNYGTLPVSSPAVDNSITIGSLAATETITVTDVDENNDGVTDGYKQVSAQMDWTEPNKAGKNVSLSLVTYLAP